jgi:hypothetical protein
MRHVLRVLGELCGDGIYVVAGDDSQKKATNRTIDST